MLELHQFHVGIIIISVVTMAMWSTVTAVCMSSLSFVAIQVCIICVRIWFQHSVMFYNLKFHDSCLMIGIIITSLTFEKRWWGVQYITCIKLCMRMCVSACVCPLFANFCTFVFSEQALKLLCFNIIDVCYGPTLLCGMLVNYIYLKYLDFILILT